MVYGPTRSVNAELHMGATDGKYKKVIQNRGGFVDSATYEDRRALDDQWYGIHEVNPKVSPDGVVSATADYVVTPALVPFD